MPEPGHRRVRDVGRMSKAALTADSKGPRHVTNRMVRERQRGQIVVVAVIAILSMVAMAGLVIDGGAVFAQQRVAQNGADGAATAGTVVIAEMLGSATVSRNNSHVWAAVNSNAAANGLGNWSAEYTTDFGTPLGVPVTNDTNPIPASARGVHVTGDRTVSTTFSRVLGVNQLRASAEATVVAGKLSPECVADDDGCTLLPVTFPVQVSQCNAAGELLPGPWIGAPPPGHEGEGYWPVVGQESLPSTANPSGDETKMAILPFCRESSGGSGAFGKLDLAPGMNFPQEITGPLNVTVNIPDWFQTQAGNVESVDGELSAYIGKPVLIPLNNGACREDPGNTEICALPGTDPAGNNTWYYVHTLAVFYIDEVNIQGSEGQQCDNAPGSPLVPDVNGAGFLGCLKGWFVNYVTSGPIIPGGEIIRGQTAIGIQLIK